MPTANGLGISLSICSGGFASGGDGGFEWEPEGVIFGIDFQTDRVFNGETVTDDYASVISGLDLDLVSSRGMRMAVGEHHPLATGALKALLDTLDYTILIIWERDEDNTNYVNLLTFNVDGSATMEIQYNYAETYASDAGGDYNDLGPSLGWSDNAIAVSFNVDGLLASVNGETAVLSEPQVGGVPEDVPIGSRGDGNGLEINGWIKAIIFYEATNAAGVELYATNTAPVNTVAPAISGFQEADGTLSVDTGTWTGSPVSYEYHWRSDGTDIPGETTNELELTGGLDATAITCLVQAVNAQGGRTGIVVANPVPANSEQPAITGITEVGATLTCSTGVWTNSPSDYVYQWYSGENPVGADSATYEIQPGDDGEMIACGVTAVNAHGQAQSFANAVGPVTTP